MTMSSTSTRDTDVVLTRTNSRVVAHYVHKGQLYALEEDLGTDPAPGAEQRLLEEVRRDRQQRLDHERKH